MIRYLNESSFNTQLLQRRNLLTSNRLCYNIVNTMIQKIIRVGNSVAVTIPPSFIKEKKLKVGDEVQVDVEPITKVKRTTLTPEFIKWVDKYIENNRPALKELASK